MPEMAHAREDHRHAELVGRVNDFLIAHGAAGLGRAGDADLPPTPQASRIGIKALRSPPSRQEHVRGHECEEQRKRQLQLALVHLLRPAGA